MDSIEIKGYKSFKHLTISLRKINILIGSNGSGKSNFLSFFEFLNALYETKLGQYVALRGGTEKFLFEGSKNTQTISARVNLGRNRYSFNIQEGDGNFIFLKESLGYCSPKGYINNDYDISDNGKEANIASYDGLQRGAYIRKYLASIKKYHFHDTGLTSPFTKTCNIHNDRYFLYRNGENLAAFLYYIREDNPISYKKIRKVIQSVAPYFHDFYFQPDQNGNIRLQWNDRYSENVYGPNDLSDGTVRFIALATLFLQPHLPSVIIIDEPELGLHPFAIQKLSGLIHSTASKGTQVIVATQSAQLISHFMPEDIITVNQIDGASIMNRLNSKELHIWLDDYSLGELWKQNILKGGQPR